MLIVIDEGERLSGRLNEDVQAAWVSRLEEGGEMKDQADKI